MCLISTTHVPHQHHPCASSAPPMCLITTTHVPHHHHPCASSGQHIHTPPQSHTPHVHKSQTPHVHNSHTSHVPHPSPPHTPRQRPDLHDAAEEQPSSLWLDATATGPGSAGVQEGHKATGGQQPGQQGGEGSMQSQAAVVLQAYTQHTQHPHLPNTCMRTPTHHASAVPHFRSAAHINAAPPPPS